MEFDELEYRNKAQSKKGQLIGAVAGLEMKMSMFLSNYLSELKHRDYMMYLLNKANFNSKVAVLEDIIENNPKLKAITYDKFFAEFRSVNDIRNTLAHSFLFTHEITDFKNEPAMRLLTSNKLNRAKFTYKFDDFKTDLAKINNVDKCLISLGEAIKP